MVFNMVVAGVMGYPAKNWQPARYAPQATASFPSKRVWDMVLLFREGPRGPGFEGSSDCQPSECQDARDRKYLFMVDGRNGHLSTLPYNFIV